MKYILTLVAAAFTLSACSITDDHGHATCPHSKGKKDECCSTEKADDCCATKPATKAAKKR